MENNGPINIRLPDNEPEETIFRKDGTIDVYQILSIRKSHEAYSNSDRIRGINQRPGVNLGINSNDEINRNTANHLITQLNSNNPSNQIIRNRNKRWLGRKRIENISNLANQSELKGKKIFLYFKTKFIQLFI